MLELYSADNNWIFPSISTSIQYECLCSLREILNFLGFDITIGLKLIVSTISVNQKRFEENTVIFWDKSVQQKIKNLEIFAQINYQRSLSDFEIKSQMLKSLEAGLSVLGYELQPIKDSQFVERRIIINKKRYLQGTVIKPKGLGYGPEHHHHKGYALK